MAASSERIRAIAIANLKASPAKSAVLLIGVGVLLFLIARQLGGGTKSAAADAAALAPPAAGSAVASAAAPAPRKRLPRPTIARTLARDPFAVDWLGVQRTTATSAENANANENVALVLQCTLTGLGGTQPSIAVISGMVVEQGARVGGYEVAEIGVRHAVLQRGDDRITLKLP